MIFSTKRKPSQHILFSALIYFCFMGWTYGQEQNFKIPDSLKIKSSKELAQILKTAKQGEATFYEKVVLERLEENDMTLIYQLGKQFYKEENYKKGHQYLDKSCIIAVKNNDQESICKIFINKARAYMLDGKNQEAVDYYNKAIDVAKEYRYKQLELIAMSGYMILLSQIGDQLNKALDISHDLLKTLDRSNDRNTRYHVRMLTSINDVFLEAERYDDVLLYANKGIKIADSLDFKIGLVDLYIKKGIAYYYKKEKKESYFFLDKAENVIKENELENSFHQRVGVNYFLAKHHYDEGLYSKAIQYLIKIIETTKEEDTNKLPIIQTYDLLMLCYREMGDDEKAWSYHKSYTDLNKIYQKSEVKTRNRIFEREFDTRIEEERKRTDLEKINKQYAQIGLLIVFVLLIVGGYSFSRKQKKNKTFFNNLINQIDQLESNQQQKEDQEKTKEAIAITIDDDKVNAILKGLAKLEKQEYFLRAECNLRAIAKKTKTNATYLSKIINTYKGKNFNGYINDLRINYALKRLKDDRRFRSFSIASIALEVGYKSDKSFVKHFKSKTGINPSYYIKNLETLNNNAA